MNKRKLERIAKWLEAGAPHKGRIAGFDMEHFRKEITENGPRYEYYNFLRPNEEPERCGAICCIAGAAVQFEQDSRSPSKALNGVQRGTAYDDLAADILGITNRQAKMLFFAEDEDGEQLWDLSSITPAWAARCVRKLMETGEVDWRGTRGDD